MNYRFHVNVMGRPYTCRWEDAAASLQKLPRMIFEADGSWIWSGDDSDGNRWQIDGHLFDFDDRLYRVELRGGCPAESFDPLLACFGWPEVDLTFELVREGIPMSEADFRQHVGKHQPD